MLRTRRSLSCRGHCRILMIRLINHYFDGLLPGSRDRLPVRLKFYRKTLFSDLFSTEIFYWRCSRTLSNFHQFNSFGICSIYFALFTRRTNTHSLTSMIFNQSFFLFLFISTFSFSNHFFFTQFYSLIIIRNDKWPSRHVRERTVAHTRY